MNIKASMIYAQYKNRVESELLYLDGQIKSHQDEIDGIELRIQMLKGDLNSTNTYMFEEVKK